MSAIGLEVLDSTLQQANHWLGGINAVPGWGDRQLGDDAPRSAALLVLASRLSDGHVDQVRYMMPGRGADAAALR